MLKQLAFALIVILSITQSRGKLTVKLKVSDGVRNLRVAILDSDGQVVRDSIEGSDVESARFRYFEFRNLPKGQLIVTAAEVLPNGDIKWATPQNVMVN